MNIVIKIKAIIVKDRMKKVFPLAFGSSGTDQSAFRGGTRAFDPDSTAPCLGELLGKWALNILEGKWSQPLLEGYQRRGLSNGCWKRIPQRYGAGEKTVFK